jgi:hypothetical protein|uniref:Uncharacterized protein n=1 Tax=Siphoviridae sp. cteLh2 TaxID=2825590 RepID=A0A8S5U5Y2_9CAUD|nr:hypothetical protein [uncultured Lachnoclostridium sp.]DAF89866.1 MAG TPA: hypothetical protein [Siphoviridae sp. cteLh2]
MENCKTNYTADEFIINESILESINTTRENFIQYGRWLERFNLANTDDNYEQYLIQGGYKWEEERNKHIKDELFGFLVEVLTSGMNLGIINRKADKYYVLDDFQFRFNEDNTLLHIETMSEEINIPITEETNVNIGVSEVQIGDFIIEEME